MAMDDEKNFKVGCLRLRVKNLFDLHQCGDFSFNNMSKTYEKSLLTNSDGHLGQQQLSQFRKSRTISLIKPFLAHVLFLFVSELIYHRCR